MLRHQQWGKGSLNDEKRFLFLNKMALKGRGSGKIIGNCNEVICERSLNCRFFCQGVVRFLLFFHEDFGSPA